MGKISEEIFCAFCKLQRVAYTKKHVGWANVLLCILMSALLMLFIWQGFDARVMVLFVGFLAVAEVFVVLRWRLSSVCPYCGFDPVLYLNDQPQAMKKVKQVLGAKGNSTDLMLSTKNPFRNLPKRKLTDEYVALHEPAKTSEVPQSLTDGGSSANQESKVAEIE